MEIFPKYWDETKKYLKPPPRNVFVSKIGFFSRKGIIPGMLEPLFFWKKKLVSQKHALESVANLEAKQINNNSCGFGEVVPLPRNKTNKQIHPWKLTCALKRDHFRRKIVFQPSFVRGYVSFWGEYHLLLWLTQTQQIWPIHPFERSLKHVESEGSEHHKCHWHLAASAETRLRFVELLSNNLVLLCNYSPSSKVC